MVICASVIFLSNVYADAVKVKPLRNRLFAPACVASKLYLISKRVVFNVESVLGNGSGLGYGDSYINIKALDSVSAFSHT